MALICVYACRLLVIDEIESLLCDNQQLLYPLFEWPKLPNSRLIFVGMSIFPHARPNPYPLVLVSTTCAVWAVCGLGISNAVDLTSRFLPELEKRHCAYLSVMDDASMPVSTATTTCVSSRCPSPLNLRTLLREANRRDHSRPPAVRPALARFSGPRRRGTVRAENCARERRRTARAEHYPVRAWTVRNDFEWPKQGTHARTHALAHP